MGESQIVQQNAKWFDANRSLPDVLMAVELRSSRRLGIVAMNNLHIVQSNGCIEMLQGLVDAFLADDVISGNVRVASIDASRDGHDAAQAIDNFGDLLEAAA